VRLQLAIWLIVLPCAWADTIHLKNGRTIQADSVREAGDRVEYDIGDDNYAIPKSAVERIERGAGLTSPSASATIGTSLAAPKVGAGNVAPIAPDNITPERVAQIEASGDKSKLASALVALAIQRSRRPKSSIQTILKPMLI
jgi:hypothetical protein